MKLIKSDQFVAWAEKNYGVDPEGYYKFRKLT